VSYEIHPDTPPEGISLERLFGPGAAQRLEPLRQRCVELGLPFNPSSRLSNTRLAVEAAEFARDAGKLPGFHRAALAAYFAQSQDIGDLEVLARLAEEIGLDAAALKEALAGGAYAARRRAIEQEAAALGITGVPTFFFAGGPKVVGAQPLDYFRRLLASLGAAER
jgi:predicted DsbA family dithiol-disulfide isomerase